MAGCAEIDLDPQTGVVEVVDYVGVVDCGTVINPQLARVQTEGGIMQGIGMTLTEQPRMDALGRTMSNSFLQYKLPTRMDAHSIRVDFVPSYEPTGPFGAKSIGECVINTPRARHRGCGVPCVRRENTESAHHAGKDSPWGKGEGRVKLCVVLLAAGRAGGLGEKTSCLRSITADR